MSTSAILIVSGLACLGLFGFAIARLRPQEGRPPSRWANGDTGGTLVGVSLTVLLVMGMMLFLKGLFS